MAVEIKENIRMFCGGCRSELKRPAHGYGWLSCCGGVGYWANVKPREFDSRFVYAVGSAGYYFYHTGKNPICEFSKGDLL